MLYSILWRIHAILMISSFLSLCSGIIISLFFKNKKWRYGIHKKLGIYAGASGITALLTAGIMVQASGGYHLGSIHAIIGLAAGLLLIINPGIGLRIVKSGNKNRLKLIHRVLGGLTAATMLAAILLGLRFVGII